MYWLIFIVHNFSISKDQFILIAKNISELFPETPNSLWFSEPQPATAASPKDVGTSGWLYKEYKDIRLALRRAKRLRESRRNRRSSTPEVDTAENRTSFYTTFF